MALATLVSWLATEGLGAYMLASWVASVRRDAAGAAAMSRPVLFGHAGLAFTGLVCWISFLLTGSAVASWLAIGFLAPAIGLGISTVTIWTPYPSSPASKGTGVFAAPPAPAASAVISADMLDRMLADETLTSKLVDDLLASMLAPRPSPRRQPWRLEPLIPATHGVLAITTFLFAMLTAISALR